MDRTKAASRASHTPLSTHWGARAIASCALVLLLAVLGGCGGATSATTSAQVAASVKASPARVALHLDTGSYTLAAPSARIAGTVTRGALVRVNGHAATVRSGRWSRTLALHLGGNRIRVIATMHGRTPAAKSIRVTRERSAAEEEARTQALALEAEAKKRKAAEAEERKAAEERKTTAEETPACTNGTYVNSAGNTVCRPEHAPTAPEGATAECVDGTYSFSESRSGTCSHHGGVARWL